MRITWTFILALKLCWRIGELWFFTPWLLVVWCDSFLWHDITIICQVPLRWVLCQRPLSQSWICPRSPWSKEAQCKWSPCHCSMELSCTCQPTDYVNECLLYTTEFGDHLLHSMTVGVANEYKYLLQRLCCEFLHSFLELIFIKHLFYAIVMRGSKATIAKKMSWYLYRLEVWG